MPIQPQPRIWIRTLALVTRFRWIALGLAAAITALCLGAAPSLSTNVDPTGYIPKDRPDVKTWFELTNRFDGLSTLMVGLEEPGEPFTFDGLARLSRITDQVGALKTEGVLTARSLTNVDSIREDEEGTLNNELLVPSVPRTQEGMAELKQRVLSDLQVPGALVSRDLKAYVIMVRTDPKKDGNALAARVMDLVEAERGPMKAFYFGGPFVGNQISRRVYSKLPWVVPVFGAALFAVLLLWLRRVRPVLLVLGCSVVPLAWWMGFMGLFGIPVSVPTLNGLLLILAIGAALYARAAELRLKGSDAPLSWRALQLLVAGAVAFAALAIYNRHVPESLPYLAQFGEGMVVGMLSIALFGLLGAIPFLSLLKPDPRMVEAANRPKPAHVAAPATTGRRVLAVGVALVLLGVGLFATSNLRFIMNLPEMFGQDEDPAQAVAFFDRLFGGNDLFQVGVEGDFRAPADAARILRLTDLLEGTGEFPDVRAFTQILGFVAKNMSGVYWVPPRREALQSLWFFLEGIPDAKAMINDNRDEAMVVARIPRTSATRVKELEARVREAIDLSAKTGREGATLRLEALARRFALKVPAGRIAEVVAAGAATETPEDLAARQAEELGRLKAWIQSPDAPFNPPDAEWDAVAKALAGGSPEEAGKVVAGLPSFKASGAPERVAAAVADTLATRLRDDLEKGRSEALTKRLLAGVDLGPQPDVATARIRGVLAELLGGAAEPADKPMTFTVSGMPTVLPQVEGQLLHGIRVSGLLVLGVFTLMAILFAAIGRRPGDLRAIPEALVASIVTWALGWALGIQVDSGSATLYLLPGTVSWFLSPRLADPRAAPGRYPLTFAMAFAAAALSLLLTGVMPVVRLGAVMALGLAASAGVAAMGDWLWEPVEAGRELVREIRQRAGT